MYARVRTLLSGCQVSGRRIRVLRLGVSLFALILGGAIFACAGSPDGPPGSVHVLTADGTVNPVMERYINRGINAAEDDDAAAVVIRLDTPGGLSSSMDDIDRHILNSEVPVIVYVWPSGGQAASAGTFIAYAAHVAVMAPGTVIGAATPIDASGDDIEGDLGNKVKGNAVAKIREYAALRGRNADWAEQAVLEGISASAGDAVELGVVDYEASNLEELLNEVDGREVALGDNRRIELKTADAALVYNDTNFIEEFLAILADPNIAFLLLSFGSLGIFIEFLHPGAIFPGVFGVICLLFGFFALSVLPFNWAGVALILFAFLLFALELFITSHGILGIGGIVALVLGGLLLTADNPPGFRVSPALIVGLAGTLFAFVIFVFANVLRIRRLPAQIGVETLVGRPAVARSELNPKGLVFVDGEYWSAELESGEVTAGERVVITGMEGLKLRVKKPESGGEQA
ncbi:MAG TPA: nodulation protein NfeD [Dehalococcoidia bacterium]|nr:nodulation protein NfeD [Dehalococcoidia bacterium]